MSSFSTIPPSREQMYCCFSRLPQDLCSMLKLTVADDSLAEYSDTGTETSPNEMVAFPIERGGIRTHIRCKSEARQETAAESTLNYLRSSQLPRSSTLSVSHPCLMHPAVSLLSFIKMPSHPDRLSPYRAKRSLDRTPEPSEISAELTELGAPQREINAGTLRPMLAQSQDHPFDAPGWLFELKLDGYRVLAARDDRARLFSRNGNDLSACFPEVMQALKALPFDRLLLDGELVALDDAGRPNFQRLQQRAQLRRAIDIRHAAVECPVTFYAFDLLGFGMFDVRTLPLSARKGLLQRLVPPNGVIRYLDHFQDEGKILYQQVQKLGLEGIVAKRADSPYKAGRSDAWIKIRTRRTEDFVVVGFTEPKGGRSGFGALYLGSYHGGNLRYSGRAGSGFSERQLGEVRKTLEALRRATPPCDGNVPQGDGTRWVEPELVCEVEYTERTEEGLLRQPVFLRFRDDKKPEECIADADRGEAGDVPLEPAGAAAPRAASRAQPSAPSSAFSNTAKVFWPDSGYTKGDLIEYYRSVSRWIVPYLADRPVV